MLTSMDDQDLTRTGIDGSAHDHVMRLTDLSREAGLDGIVCSGQEVKSVHDRWKDGFFVVPGLRPAGSAVGDQKRVVTPAAGARRRRERAGHRTTDQQGSRSGAGSARNRGNAVGFP